MKPLNPQPLKKGDTIGVFAPAGQLANLDRFRSGVTFLSEMGFKVTYQRELWPGTDYLADSDNNRSYEFNRLMRDPEVKALIALRGGYGCLRMIGGIDLDLVFAHPKLITGFSDISILQNFLFANTGLISLHGPVISSLGSLSKNARERLLISLLGKWNENIRVPELEVLRNGTTRESPLVGGNLASLTSLLGTRFECSWDDKIVILEDVNEPLYRVDRMLTQMGLAGKFAKMAGLILGDFANPETASRTSKIRYIESIWQRVKELCDDAGGDYPIWGNFPFGHCSNNLTLPLGANALMESSIKTLSFPQSRAAAGYDV